jgi:hypothetical protein
MGVLLKGKIGLSALTVSGPVACRQSFNYFPGSETAVENPARQGFNA